MSNEWQIDLQWFAAEDEGRTQDPTEVTYRKAREEGRVAKSQDFIGALGLLMVAVAIFFLAPGMLRTCAEMLRFFFTRVNEIDPINDKIAAGIFLNYFLRLTWPVLAIAVVAAFFSNLIQTGLFFTAKPLTPDFKKIIPHFGRFFKKAFIFSGEGLFNLAKNIFKMAVIGVVAYLTISGRINELANLQKADLWTSVTLIASMAGRMLIISAILLLALSIPDFIYQKWQFKESLKMTKEQAKEELKQDEGDPLIRSRLRARYRDLLTRDMLNKVPQADVVITNPTHYSVALEYNLEMKGPKVIAKGEDDLAMRIREIAKANGVPIARHPPLTRALYAETEVGDIIPVKYWQVTALLLRAFFIKDKNQPRAERMEA
ncbi:EscU/YscU/HrcU family type III secretion system export apparatus switch protein [Leadbettera azotonutricia]|uniref:Flagellar biosynthetic protein FlhB n=1 Tax=Leadbettera azotonutricia (strain ATCC BAA-888 / DSM 13862 / ZAS-9) TaxID=545695 RepID=F5YEU9_LEAAZ|nr:EscU/YscU/HrcU family type III secretion system export apparatus switch protein [Leadbettera azotonutricia]AEF80785.1 flagellar biosynthetic protein FlhB [Leadbettera azotonutricia ZAS-9]